jgi:hypothetical protein
MSSNRHNISNDFIIQDIQNVKDQHFSLEIKMAAAGTIPCEKNVLLTAQTNEFFLFDALYSAASSASPFSFWSGTQDSAFSISAWYHPTDAPAATAGIVTKGQWMASAKREWGLFHLTTGKILLQLFDESADSYIGKVTSSAISNDVWHHIVVTYSGSETSAGIKIYVDGAAVSLATYETGTYSGMDTSAGGYYGLVGSTNTKAHMSDISVWSTELTAADVTSMYNSRNPTNLMQEAPYITDHGSLIGWWRMGNYYLDVIKSGGGSSSSVDNIIYDNTGNSRHLIPYIGFNGDEIVTARAIGSARPGDDADNNKDLPNPIVAPFSFNNRGVPNLRRRNSAYKVTKG